MASVNITKRMTASGPRYDVRFRRGGADSPLERGGTFKTKREADLRSAFIGGLLATGQDPRPQLHVVAGVVEKAKPLRQWGEDFIASRVDVSSGTLANYRIHLLAFDEAFG